MSPSRAVAAGGAWLYAASCDSAIEDALRLRTTIADRFCRTATARERAVRCTVRSLNKFCRLRSKSKLSSTRAYVLSGVRLRTVLEAASAATAFRFRGKLEIKG